MEEILHEDRGVFWYEYDEKAFVIVPETHPWYEYESKKDFPGRFASFIDEDCSEWMFEMPLEDRNNFITEVVRVQALAESFAKKQLQQMKLALKLQENLGVFPCIKGHSYYVSDEGSSAMLDGLIITFHKEEQHWTLYVESVNFKCSFGEGSVNLDAAEHLLALN